MERERGREGEREGNGGMIKTKYYDLLQLKIVKDRNKER